MDSFSALKKNLKKDFAGLPVLRIAVLADSASQLFVQAFRGAGYNLGINFLIFESDYNQIQLQILDPHSDLYAFHPDYTIVFQSTQKLRKKFYELSYSEKTSFSTDQLRAIVQLTDHLHASSKSRVIYFNFPEVTDNIYGNFANKLAGSFIYQLRSINLGLMNLAITNPQLYINDLSALHNQFGYSFVHDEKVYINTDILFSIDFLPIIARNTAKIIQSIQGTFIKCVILDLDNTLWGGTIGDDGVESIQIGDLGGGKAFTEFQHWLKQLKNRGIILAVCSKNTEAIAKAPFENHPDMVLRLTDIAVFIANWETKVDNIRHIQSILNIGFDSMVFLDDNPFERDMVRTHLPEITVPELPEDPAEYLQCLQVLNLFETASFTEEDTTRTKQYQTEARRAELQKTFSDENDFLQSLKMNALVQPFTRFNCPRVTQLSQRSNQFNLRTTRYTEDMIKTLSESGEYYTLAFSLADKYGDNGLIALAILEKQDTETLFIETWLMSCRVLKRGMENFMLNTIVELACKNGFKCLKGEYLPTLKNALVKNHYENLGFNALEGHWLMDANSYQARPTFIEHITETNVPN